MTPQGPRRIAFFILIVLILLLIPLQVSPASWSTENPGTRSPRTIIVNASGGGDYTHIQWAIDNASDGDIINVQEGVFNENLVLNKSITLLGKGPNKTIINGIGNWYAICIKTNGVVLKGFKINTDEGNGVRISKVSNCYLSNNFLFAYNGRGISIGRSDNIQILNNSLTSDNESIYISYSNSVHIINNTLEPNNNVSISIYKSIGTIIVNNKMIDGGISIWGDLITHWNTHEIEVSNTVNGKIIYYWKNVTNSMVPSDSGQVILVNCTGILVNNLDSQYGIDLIASSNNEIRNNVCTGGHGTGILLSKSNNNSLINNTSNYNNIGINILESNDNQIISNICNRNIWGIVLSDGIGNTFSKNICNINKGFGISISQSNDNLLEKNKFGWNYYDGISLGGRSEGNVISNNVCNNNGRNGISIGYSESTRNMHVERNQVKSNTCNNNGEYGIYINRYTEDIEYSNNDANSNGIGDIYYPSDSKDISTFLGLLILLFSLIIIIIALIFLLIYIIKSKGNKDKNSIFMEVKTDMTLKDIEDFLTAKFPEERKSYRNNRIFVGGRGRPAFSLLGIYDYKTYRLVSGWEKGKDVVMIILIWAPLFLLIFPMILFIIWIMLKRKTIRKMLVAIKEEDARIKREKMSS